MERKLNLTRMNSNLLILMSAILLTGSSTRDLFKTTDIYDFRLNPSTKLCSDFDKNQTRRRDASTPNILIYIHTSPENFKRRLFIRETWASRTKFSTIRMVFVMGWPINDSMATIESRLKLESSIYNDLVSFWGITFYCDLTFFHLDPCLKRKCFKI
jgi:hypothetical protein